MFKKIRNHIIKVFTICQNNFMFGEEVPTENTLTLQTSIITANGN